MTNLHLPVGSLIPFRPEPRWRIRHGYYAPARGAVYYIERRRWRFWFVLDHEYTLDDAYATLRRRLSHERALTVDAVVAEVDDDGNWT